MRGKQHFTVITCFIPTLFSIPATADELIMANGDRLSGTLEKQQNGTLDFKTTYAGTIKVQWADVKELRTDDPVKVLLSNEEVIEAQVIRNRAAVSEVEAVAGGKTAAMKRSDIAVIKPAPWELGQGYRLTGRVNLSLESERGNTDTDEIDVDGEVVFRRKRDRVRVAGELENDRTDGEKTADKWQVRSAYHYFPSKKWFYGANLYAESDEFADLTLRVGAGPLVGHQFVESKAMNLSVEANVSRVHEEFSSEDDDNYWAAGWRFHFDKYLFGDIVQFYHEQGGLWNLNETDDVLAKFWTGLRFPLAGGLVASTELKVEYDSGAATDAKELDTTYQLKLGYQW